MEAVRNDYLGHLLEGLGALPRSPRTWVNVLRAEALEQANALTVPSTRDEEWRFTDLSPLYRTSFKRVEGLSTVSAADVSGFALPEAGSRLVFVDGQFVPALSTLAPGAGVTVKPLGLALAQQDGLVSEHLGRYAPFRSEPFTAVNTAWLSDGAVVAVGRNQVAEKPVHLLCMSTRADVVSFPRLLVVAEAGGEVTLIEDFVALHDGGYLTNAVAEIAVAENAAVRHIRLQRESKAAFHITTCSVRLARDARYQSVAVTLGARMSRHNLNITQAGEGADCQIDGLALIDGRQLADTHSFLDHTCPNGRSRQVHKCIVGGAAHAVFNGKIFVRPGAQGIDSAQESRNLLLTDRAHVDTKPQLEIFADDVRCAHGAAIGQLDPDQVFYLKSRGLSEAAARDLLTFAFAAEIVKRIPVPTLVQRLQEAVVRQTKVTQG